MLLGLAIPLVLTATIFAVPSVQSGSDGGNVAASLDSQFSATPRAAQAESGKVHQIHMTAVELQNGQLAYKMLSHLYTDDSETPTNITGNYSNQPTIPGPTIVLTEGDEVFLTIHNNITSKPKEQVSVHVHGVHYEIDSDGTLEHVNMLFDQGAYPGGTYTYHWIASPSSAGTWPYHDHTFGGINGAEHKGLFGTVIVNPASLTVRAVDGNTIQNNVSVSEIKKDFVLYLGDDAFWGMEIAENGQQTPLWVNPTLVAKKGDYVRFHLIALGTDFHQFKLSNVVWLDPGTNNLISQKSIGPLENHVFTFKADKSNTQYLDLNESNNLMGMKGTIMVTNSGGNSIPGPSPL